MRDICAAIDASRSLWLLTEWLGRSEMGNLNDSVMRSAVMMVLGSCLVMNDDSAVAGDAPLPNALLSPR